MNTRDKLNSFEKELDDLKAWLKLREETPQPGGAQAAVGEDA